MLQLLISLLTPIFEGMGVSPADVATYVNNLSGYIYAILGALVLAAAVIIAAQLKVPKGKRHLVSRGGWTVLDTDCHHSGQCDLLWSHVQQSRPHPEL